MTARRTVVTGGAGYIGSLLVPALLERGHDVVVVDRLVFGDAGVRTWPEAAVELVRADVRDTDALRRALRGADTVVHLAALANDPSADLDPVRTRRVNLDAVLALVDLARRAGTTRFVNASSASVYGIQRLHPATEDSPLRPITLYGRYKAESEAYVLARNDPSFTTTSIRAATVCGFSPRQRLDLTVNIFTYQIVVEGRVTVHGGEQTRPNVHVADLVDAYVRFVEAPPEVVGGRAFNVGWENHSIREIVALVCATLGAEPEIETVPVVDERSYALASERVTAELGIRPRRSVGDAIRELAEALEDGRVPAPASSIYRNVEYLRSLHETPAREEVGVRA